MQISVRLPRMEKGNPTGLAPSNCFSGELILLLQHVPMFAAAIFAATGNDQSLLLANVCHESIWDRNGSSLLDFGRMIISSSETRPRL